MMTEVMNVEITKRAPTMADLDMTVALMNACAMADIGRVQNNRDTVAKQWMVPGFELGTDACLIFAPMGELIGYVAVFDLEPHVYPYVWGCVHPDYRGNGIGGYLLDWAEARAQKAQEKAPSDHRVTVRTDLASTNAGAVRLFTGRGYRPVRHFWRMVRELDQDSVPDLPDWPEGITVRPYIPKLDDRFVYTLVQEAFKDHWGHTHEPFDRWMHWMTAGENFDPRLWHLAVTTESGGNELAGVALCRPFENTDPDMGWISVLAVSREWRRQGLGLALLHYAFGEYHRRGKLRVGLGVDADSLTGATRLYEKAGMRAVQQWDVYEKVLRDGLKPGTAQLDDM